MPLTNRTWEKLKLTQTITDFEYAILGKKDKLSLKIRIATDHSLKAEKIKTVKISFL